MSRIVYSNLGTCYFVLALYADAVEMYELALGMDKSSYATWGNLAATYNVLLDEKDKAVEHYTRASELAEEQLKLAPRDEEILASLAVYSAELGDTAKAWDYLGRSMEQHPDDSRVMFDVGLAHEVLGEREVAIEWIVRSVESGFSKVLVETTPGLRGLCSDERYGIRVGRGRGR
jgi:tetratricopeptide (TPR) repeat protein